MPSPVRRASCQRKSAARAVQESAARKAQQERRHPRHSANWQLPSV